MHKQKGRREPRGEKLPEHGINGGAIHICLPK